jgi:hypothetical protein
MAMITCAACRDELLLYLNHAEVLTPVLRQHLGVCEECHRYYRELGEINRRLGDDASFLPDDLDEEQFVAAVERGIAGMPPPRVVVSVWRRYLPAVAAILMVFGITLLGSREMRIDYSHDGAARNQALSESGSLLCTLYATEVDDFDDEVLDLILSDFAAKAYFEAGERLLDDLSEEELQYLEENFDVGDIL